MNNHLDQFVRAYEGNLQYDFDNRIVLNWYPQRILTLAKNARSVLELGLGHGYTTAIFAKHFPRHCVVEGSAAVIENFRQKFPGCSAEIAEGFFEEFESLEKFDLVVMGFVLEHVDDPGAVLRHYKRFLAPGGRLFVGVPNAEAMNRRLGNLMGLLPDMQVLSDNDYLLGHQRYYTVDTLRHEAANAGYETVRMEGIFLKPLTTGQLTSLQLGDAVIEALCRLGIEYPELCVGLLAELKPNE